MSEAKAPGAIALTAMRSLASRSAMRRVRCTSPALLAPYEYVSCELTDRPSIEAMLMTFARWSVAAARSIGVRACVRKKGALRFRSTTLSQPLSGNSS